MKGPNWDDFRFVLAVARSGSVSGAARELGVNHATVLRRVAAFEDRLGVELFVKSVRGYEIPPEKLRLIEAAREVEAAVGAVERLARAGEAPLSGVIRVTSTDSFCHAVLPPVLARLSTQAPALSFELLSTNAHLDLARLHADVTVRPTLKLPEDLHGEVAVQMAFGFYAASVEVPADRWLGLTGPIGRSYLATRLRDELERRRVTFTAAADSFLSLLSLAEAGMGRVMLPAFLGNASPRLVPVAPAIEAAPVPVYVASHVDLADAPRLRQARARIGAALAREEARMMGRLPVTAKRA
ncbi:LysR family transcriptional regulator [Celeribacter indicus]|uniref:LysR family transcriptional regulator n=1 Tax=Celeribacter indicus TaxID=1208324 RepID=A0A0B5DVA2_9RHOB|nr:LysR family transcriptional regulator [Celeribacter indicus]AJE46949.1 LysR family transcriptional regulator [Celeribacter indicus]SDW77877.1 DNA-binding transcriptional regulator, LysR family [Celeribacter indicus]